MPTPYGSFALWLAVVLSLLPSHLCHSHRLTTLVPYTVLVCVWFVVYVVSPVTPGLCCCVFSPHAPVAIPATVVAMAEKLPEQVCALDEEQAVRILWVNPRALWLVAHAGL